LQGVPASAGMNKKIVRVPHAYFIVRIDMPCFWR
jgi:hypothetical protein